MNDFSDNNFFVSKINLDGIENEEAHLHIHKADSKAYMKNYYDIPGANENY